MTRWTPSWEMTRLLSYIEKALVGGCFMAYCPECEAVIEVEDDIEEGARMDCADCGAQLEVVNTNPVELGVVSTEEEEEDEAW
jgi:alpha-aminoadipate carrier protein LysW